jgi:hypothetical protein
MRRPSNNRFQRLAVARNRNGSDGLARAPATAEPGVSAWIGGAIVPEVSYSLSGGGPWLLSFPVWGAGASRMTRRAE